MWNFQKKLRDIDSKTYTAAEVHAELTAMMLLFMSDIQSVIEHKELPQPVVAEHERLSKLGFSRSKNIEHTTRIINEVQTHNADYDKKVDALKYMFQAWVTFGRDTMIVRYDQFLSLLEKYNLVCGSFDRYTGTIPEDNLEDIERVVAILDSENCNMVIPFRYITEVDTDNNNLKYLQWFNLFPLDSVVRSPLFSYMGLHDMYAEEEWPRGRFEMSSYISVEDRRERRYSNLTSQDCYIFIAAPAQEMADFEVKTYSSKAIRKYYAEKERLERQLERRVLTLDPFVCSLTPFGVMIYTKWGAEAEDATIKRYEQLREAIMGGAK